MKTREQSNGRARKTLVAAVIGFAAVAGTLGTVLFMGWLLAAVPPGC